MASEILDEKAIFNTARKIDSPEARSEYLQQVCGADADLLERVGTLLGAYEEQASFLESPPAAIVPPTIEQPLSEQLGNQIGPYKLLHQIGEGGMGVVWMAEQTEPVKRKVALKVIKPGMDSRQVITRFEAERQALAMMDHVNIARVLDAGATENGQPYFVMELVHGVPITKYCDDNHLTARERLELFVPVCQAVQHAHQKGIIHRDIKPSNVMVTLYDGKPVPKVIDFGVAKAIGRDWRHGRFLRGNHLVAWRKLAIDQKRPIVFGADHHRAGNDVLTSFYGLAWSMYDDCDPVRNGFALDIDCVRRLARLSVSPPEWPHSVAAGSN